MDMKSQNNFNETGSRIIDQHLTQLGWSSFFQEQITDRNYGQTPARVAGVRKNSYLVKNGHEEKNVTLAGKFYHDPKPCFPAVGDWVLLQNSIITSVLERKNILAKKASGGRNRKSGTAITGDQIIAANIDSVFIVCGLDRDFNLRRIERYLTMVYNCSIMPVVILTKADLHQTPETFEREVEKIAFGVPVFLISEKETELLSRLKKFLAPGHTIALVGSSGAGKSTLINRLYGAPIRATGTLSERLGKGKHTTTSRDLIVLPSSGMVIDNPGIREIAIESDQLHSESAFPDIDERALFCKFPDCSHTHEPGCHVLEAVSSGHIDHARLKSYQKIQSERTYLLNKETKGAARTEKERWKGVALKAKSIKKRRKL